MCLEALKALALTHIKDLPESRIAQTHISQMGLRAMPGGP